MSQVANIRQVNLQKKIMKMKVLNQKIKALKKMIEFSVVVVAGNLMNKLLLSMRKSAKKFLYKKGNCLMLKSRDKSMMKLNSKTIIPKLLEKLFLRINNKQLKINH